MDIDAFINNIKAYPVILFYERCDDDDLNDKMNLSKYKKKFMYKCLSINLKLNIFS